MWTILTMVFAGLALAALAGLHVVARSATRARNQLHRARNEAREAKQAHDRFIAMLSHEFRTPLNAVVAYAELLEVGILGPVTPRQRTTLIRLRTAAGHLTTLVNDVLQVARLEANVIQLRSEPFNLGRVVTSALSLVAPQASEKKIGLSTDRPRGQVVGIGDRDRVRQIIVNLLSNAIKFTPEGGHVTVACGADETRARCWLSVRDTGIGIPEKDQRRIFDPFEQGTNTLIRSSQGTGLGLTICRQLAEAMGGEVQVSSKPGEGSIFTVWLPAAPATNRPRYAAIAPENPVWMTMA